MASEKITRISVFVLLFIVSTFSWEMTYGDTCEDGCRSVCNGWDEGYIILGTYDPSRDVDNQGVAFAFKISEEGDSIWYNRYGDTLQYQTSNSIIPGRYNEYVILGNIRQYTNWYDPYLLVINNEGDSVRYTEYDSIGGICRSISQAGEDGYIFTGSKSYGTTGPPRDLLLVRTNRDGSIIWKRTYGGDIKCEGREVIECTDGNFLVCGNTQWYEIESGRYMENFLLLKINSEGDSLWGKTYGGRYRCSAYSIIEHLSRIYIGGYVFPDTLSIYNQDLDILCTNSDGLILWENRIGGSSHDIGPFDIELAYDEGLMLLGNTSSSGSGMSDVYLVKCSFSGDTIWSKLYGSHLDEWPYNILKTPDNGYLIAASAIDDYSHNTDIYIIKTDSLGISTSISEDYVAKPSQLQIEVSPNPFNSVVRITIAFSPCQGGDVRRTEGVNIEIFDINGRRIAELSSGETLGDGFPVPPANGRGDLAPTTRQFIWQPDKNIGSGVYLVRARFDNRSLSGAEATTTKRLVYLK